MNDTEADTWAEALGEVLARERREWRRARDMALNEIRAEISTFKLSVHEFVTERLGALRDGETGPAGADGPEGVQGPPGPPGAAGEAPDDIALLVGRGIAMLAEAAPAIAAAPGVAPVINVTIPPAARSVERMRVTKHDDKGRILEIERDVA
jgi:hypothetical protein